MDVLTAEQRRKNMSNIRSKHTKPEITVRKLSHSLGLRFRLHKKDLPGHPDLVFPRHRSVIFVNGCFWYNHNCKYGRVTPKTNGEFWREKRTNTKQRDCRNIELLRKTGWQVLALWECDIRRGQVNELIVDFFGLSEAS